MSHGRFLSRRIGNSAYGITDHVVDRFMQKWPDARHLYIDEVRNLICREIALSKKAGEYTQNPDGKMKVAISYMGMDGWAIVDLHGNVVTVYPKNEEPLTDRHP